MLWDTHMHSRFSGDSKSEPKDMANAALLRGLSGICFTDHLDYDYPDDPELFLLDFSSYNKAIRALQKEYASRLKIFYGIELGLQPHLAKKHEEALKNNDFDFVIGSSHVVHGTDPYYASYFEGRTVQSAYLEYFESILENIQAFSGFDVYGHLDYVIRYCPDKDTDVSYRLLKNDLDIWNIIEEILMQLIHAGKGIEVNTAGFKYGLGHPNPCEEILKRYRKLGGEILTIGADAHMPEHVGFCFDQVTELLQSVGFSYYTVFQKRKPLFLRLP